MTKRGPIAYITSELVNNQRERAVLKLMKQNHCFYLFTSCLQVWMIEILENEKLIH